jgi:iron complex transport system permease protein
MSRTALLAFAVVVLLAVSILLGSYTVTIPDFFRILTAHLTGGQKIPGPSFIVMENQLPRSANRQIPPARCAPMGGRCAAF